MALFWCFIQAFPLLPGASYKCEACPFDQDSVFFFFFFYKIDNSRNINLFEDSQLHEILKFNKGKRHIQNDQGSSHRYVVAADPLLL